jgi:hypothetical protein
MRLFREVADALLIEIYLPAGRPLTCEGVSGTWAKHRRLSYRGDGYLGDANLKESLEAIGRIKDKRKVELE